MGRKKKEQNIINNSLISSQDETQKDSEPIQLFDSVCESSEQNLPGNKKRTAIIVSMIAVLLALTGIFFYLAVIKLQVNRETQSIQKEELYQYLLKKETFINGIFINDVDVSGMTVQEAKNKVLDDFKSKIKNINCKYEDKSYLFEIKNSLIESDIDTVMQKAISEPITNDMESTIENVETISKEGLYLTVNFRYNDAELQTFIDSVKSDINCATQAASISSVDKDAHTVTISGSIKGQEVDEPAFKELITDALNTHKVQIQIPVTVTETDVTSQSIQMIEIVTETSFKGSSSNRIYNIKKGAGIINGTIVAPNEIFSANQILGTRTYSAGWKEANAYMGGTTDVQAGGGVCQISSTIYNSVVKADLEVVSRRNHSMPVDYISKGLDATINSTGNIIDFKFKNNTNVPIVVFTWTEGKNLFAKIVRCSFNTDEYDEIKLTAKKIATLHPEAEMEIVYDITLSPGEEVIDVARRDGSKYQSYKNYYKNGEFVKKENLDVSIYSAFNGIKRVAFDASPSPTIELITPTPIPSSVPSPTPEHTRPVVTNTPAVTSAPTAVPTQEPTAVPTSQPTAEPTTEPQAS